MVPPPADATVNKNGKRPPPSGQMYQRRAYRAALPSLDMEAFPRLENIDNTILPQSTPPASLLSENNNHGSLHQQTVAAAHHDGLVA